MLGHNVVVSSKNQINCKKLTKKFTDESFKASKQSLYDKVKLKKEDDYFRNKLHFNLRVGVWSRPESIISIQAEKLSLYSNPKPSDVVQGAIGTCWYLSSLSLLTNHLDYFKRIFLTHEINEQGMYRFLLCIRGIWETVTIDDYIPCSAGTQRIVFAKVQNNQLYPALLEKALAKVHGSYAMIIEGTCIEGLQTLTGFPCEIIYMNDAPSVSVDNKWSRVKSFHERGFLMACLCDYPASQLTMLRNGLFSKHVYSILDAKELTHNNESVRLLKLRNPWSRGEWRGEWSNKWPHWPPNLKKQLINDAHEKKDGTFWISFDDVNKYFYDITVSKIRPDQVSIRLSGHFQDYTKSIECFAFEIDQQAHAVEIELFANGRLEAPHNRKSDPLIDLCIVLCKIVSNGLLKCVQFSHKIEQMGDYVSVSATLEPGKYIVFATSIKALLIMNREIETKYTKTSRNNFKYNIVFHVANNELKIERKALPAVVMYDVFKSMLTESDPMCKYDNNVKYTIFKLKTCNAILAENLNQDSCVRIDLDTSLGKNFDDSLNRYKTTHHLCPNQGKWLVFQVPLDFTKPVNYSIRLTTEKFAYSDSCCVQTDESTEYKELFSGVYTIKSNDIKTYWSNIF